jgi:hypothetical protein
MTSASGFLPVRLEGAVIGRGDGVTDRSAVSALNKLQPRMYPFVLGAKVTRPGHCPPLHGPGLVTTTNARLIW